MASRRRKSRQTQRSHDEEPGDSGIEENTADEPAEPNNDPQPKQSPSKKSAKERFEEQSGHYKNLIEQSSRYRRKGSTSRTQVDKGAMHVGAMKPGPRVPPRPLNRDRAGEGKGHNDDEDNGPRITVMIKDKGQSNGKTRIQLPSVGASDTPNEGPTYSKTDRHHDLPTHSKEGPSYSKRDSISRAPRGLGSKSLPNTPRDAKKEEAKREPLTARGTNINKISMDDATKSLISPRKPRPAKLSPLRH